jgi:hypothetical protein
MIKAELILTRKVKENPLAAACPLLDGRIAGGRPARGLPSRLGPTA